MASMIMRGTFIRRVSKAWSTVSPSCFCYSSTALRNKKKVLSFPPFLKLRDFSKRFGLDSKKVMAQIGAKRAKKKIFWDDPLTGRSFVFKNLKQFVLPFTTMKWVVQEKLGLLEDGTELELEQKWEPELRPLPDATGATGANNEEQLVERRAVVVVLGHIDHGKTTILDSLRGANTAELEAGGITQAIGAWPISLHLNEKEDDEILETTFLDTPGHVHFYQMREDSARVATAALLVVASDEPELREQTIESINCLFHMDVPLVVVINKIDLKASNPARTRALLEEVGLLGPEGPLIGGERPAVVEISAKEKTNLRIMEQLLGKALQRQSLLAYGDDVQAEGIVIEAVNTRYQGALLRIVVSAGVLRIGQPYVSGNVVGVVRTLYNEFRKEKIEEAWPGQVVYVSGSLKGVGLSAAPPLGQPFFVLKDRKEAEKLIEYRRMIVEFAECQVSGPPFTLDPESEEKDENDETEDVSELQEAPGSDESQEGLNIIIRAESAGKLDAIMAALEETGCVTPVRHSVGPVEVGLVTLAAQEKIPVVSYGLKVNKHVETAARKKGVPIMESFVMHDIVYEIVEYARKKGFKGHHPAKK